MTGSVDPSPKHVRAKTALKLVVALVGSFVLATDGPGREAISRILANPLSLFAARSPGARAPGALTQTKQARVHIGRGGGAVAMSDADVRLALDGAPVFSDLLGSQSTDTLDMSGKPVPDLRLADLGFGGGEQPRRSFGGSSAGGLGDPSSPSSGVAPLGQGSGIPDGGDASPPVVPADAGPPVPVVPEPASWLLMLGGFALLGGALRGLGGQISRRSGTAARR